jgi:hypothetical protein
VNWFIRVALLIHHKTVAAPSNSEQSAAAKKYLRLMLIVSTQLEGELGEQGAYQT